MYIVVGILPEDHYFDLAKRGQVQRVKNLVRRRIYGSASVFFLQECIKFSVISKESECGLLKERQHKGPYIFHGRDLHSLPHRVNVFQVRAG